MLRILVIVSAFLNVLCSQNVKNNSTDIYYTPDIIKAEGYPAEIHNVITKDGYILEIHRIPYGKKCKGRERRPVAFLMHGILGDSSSFIFLGSEKSMAYNLADAGYDVWMGNARGTRNSRRHLTLDPETDSILFFDFSFEEIALEDLPTMIDYVLEQTGQKRLHYIGHSQGGTVFLILNSMKPDYNTKFVSAHLLAAVGHQRNFPNSQIRALSISTDMLYNVLRASGNVELFPPGSNGIFRFPSSIRTASLVNQSNLSALIAGAAMKQVAHFGQNIRDRAFRRWNFGAVQNLAIYGTISPPSYDLSRIKIDITLHYSLNDLFLSETDTLAMTLSLPYAHARKISRDSFTHFDYVLSKDVKKLITNYIIKALKRSSYSDSS